MSQNGKGSDRRPMEISHKEFDKKWDKIFGKKNKNLKVKKRNG